MSFVNRLVERTRADHAPIRPIVGAAHVGPAEPLPIVDLVREIEAATVDPASPAAPDASPRAHREIAKVAARRAGEDPAASQLTTMIEERAAPPIPAPPRASEPAATLLAPESSAPVSPTTQEALATPARSTREATADHPRASAPQSPATSRPQPQADQVIRVHIGRIDVRAPAPPPVQPVAARRPAEPLPSIALGRYLDERGRRR